MTVVVGGAAAAGAAAGFFLPPMVNPSSSSSDAFTSSSAVGLLGLVPSGVALVHPSSFTPSPLPAPALRCPFEDPLFLATPAPANCVCDLFLLPARCVELPDAAPRRCKRSEDFWLRLTREDDEVAAADEECEVDGAGGDRDGPALLLVMPKAGFIGLCKDRGRGRRMISVSALRDSSASDAGLTCSFEMMRSLQHCRHYRYSFYADETSRTQQAHPRSSWCWTRLCYSILRHESARGGLSL